MNKSQKTLIAIGGAVLVAVLVVGGLIANALSDSAEKSESLDDCMSAVEGIVRKLPVKPVKGELQVYDDSCAAYAEWSAGAEQFASRGDVVFDKTSSAVFKSDMVAEARRIAEHNGVYGGKIVKNDFGFGFKEYILGSALPPEGEAKLAKLQREWYDVVSVLNILVDCDVAGIADVQMGKAKSENQEEEIKPKGKNRRTKSRSRDKSKIETEGEEECAVEFPAVTSFTVEFLARPAALVNVINACTTNQRFMVIEDFGFARERDDLLEALGGDSHKREQTSNRRRRHQQSEDESAGVGKRGIVTDPESASPLKVTMALSVYDFGTLEKAKQEMEKAKAKEASAGGDKDEGGVK